MGYVPAITDAHLTGTVAVLLSLVGLFDLIELARSYYRMRTCMTQFPALKQYAFFDHAKEFRHGYDVRFCQ